MKVILSLMLLVLSQSVFAKDNYILETCGALLNGQSFMITRTDNQSGYFTLNERIGSYRDMPGYEDVETHYSEGVDLVLDVKAESNHKVKTNKDGCKKKKFDREVVVVSADSDVRKKYGFKKGSTLELTCVAYSYETMKECEL